MDFDVVDEQATFFAPVSSDAIDSLIGQYQLAFDRIEKVESMICGDLGSVINFFIEGNAGDERLHRSLYVDKLFQKTGAIAALNAHYWKRALDLTDVYDLMPQARRDQWNNQIRNPLGTKKRVQDQETGGTKEVWDIEPLPDFQEETVRSTLMDLLHARSRFFSERVDGIFRSLSHEHVTNCPQGFSKRMIIAGMFNFYSGGFASSNWSRMGIVNDLRCVVAKFMGRDDPHHNASIQVIEHARRDRPGQWISLDGGALRIRAYLKGTVHLEVHPEMAWRLNSVLANLYPAAIPAKFRTPPKRKSKQWEMMLRPLPFAVLGMLGAMEPASRRVERGFQTGLEKIPKSLAFRYFTDNSNTAIQAEAESVLEAMGGVRMTEGKAYHYWQFEYEPRDVIEEIVSSGCIPDYKSHQFYPTPDWLAKHAVELAEIHDHHDVLEPEAGTGQIAKYLPSNTTCVEISSLHCKVLESAGMGNVICDDFLNWSSVTSQRFDRIVMNPPFNEKRWSLHLNAASQLLRNDGRLVAILPAGTKNTDVLPGWDCEWSKSYDNAFPGTAVSVVILTATKP